MKKLINLSLVMVMILSLLSCATSMTPMEVDSKLPALTKSKYLYRDSADEAVNQINVNTCQREEIIPHLLDYRLWMI